MTRFHIASPGSVTPRRLWIALALSILIVAASHLSAPLTGAGPSEQGAPPAVTLQQVVGGLSQPLYVTHAGDGSGRLFVVEKAGKIKIVINGQVQATPFLDIDPLVHSGGSEQGLLGLAFHPSYQTNGRFYVFYTDEANQDDILSRYQRAGADPTRADPASGRVLLHIADPYSNHNGGMLAFGPDGYLYVGTGDGGSFGDPENRAQSLQELLGKLLRLNVDLAADVAPYYEIPPSNPYATRTDGTRREIWAYGLRNPWRFSFDRQTGDLWLGDVGQGAREEINRQPAGQRGRSELRLADHGGPELLQPEQRLQSERPDVADPGLRPQSGLLGDWRLRLPGRGGPGPARALHLRRLLLRTDLVAPPAGRQLGPHRAARHRLRHQLVRRGRGRRALPHGFERRVCLSVRLGASLRRRGSWRRAPHQPIPTGGGAWTRPPSAACGTMSSSAPGAGSATSACTRPTARRSSG